MGRTGTGTAVHQDRNCPGGQELGMGWSWMAALTLSSTSHVKVAMRQEGGRLVSGSPTSLSSWNCRDVAGPRPI